MAIVWLEGFDLYGDTTNLFKRYYGNVSSNVQLMGARTGQGLYLTPVAGDGTTIFTSEVFTPQFKMILGAAIRFDAIRSMEFLDFNRDTVTHFSLSIDDIGRIISSAGSGATTSTQTLSALTWYYLEVKFVISAGSTGLVEVRINGTTWISVSGTVNGGGTVDTTVNNIAFKVSNATGFSSVGLMLDDIYLCDTLGHYHFDYLGSLAITTYFPGADGAELQMSIAGAASHYACVNQVPADDDTSYIFASSAGQTDTFLFSAIPLDGSGPTAISCEMLASKDASQKNTITAVARRSSTDHLGSDLAVANRYLYYRTIFDYSPYTGDLWTESEFATSEFGVKRTN